MLKSLRLQSGECSLAFREVKQGQNSQSGNYIGESHLEGNTVTKGVGYRVQTSEKRPGNMRSREDWSSGWGIDYRLRNEAEVSLDC